MQYAILIYEPDHQIAAYADPARRAEAMEPWRQYSKALADAGAIRGGAALQGVQHATTVRLRDGKRTVQDGPFADTKERLGGLYLIEAPDLDRALEWAARCPAAQWGTVEVRPLMAMDDM